MFVGNAYLAATSTLPRKLVKRSVATICLTNIWNKSCSHHMQQAIEVQISCLRHSGHHEQLTIPVSQVVQRGENAGFKEGGTNAQESKKCCKAAVIPYLHGVAQGQNSDFCTFRVCSKCPFWASPDSLKADDRMWHKASKVEKPDDVTALAFKLELCFSEQIILAVWVLA